MHTIRMLAVVLVLSGISTLGHGQSSATGAHVPNLVNFAGTLKDSGRHPIQADTKGNYTVQLGATKPEGLPLDLFTSGEARWLGVTINGGQEQPRVLLLSVPYALKAADAETIGGLPPSAFVLAAPPTAAGSSSDASANSASNGVTPAVTGTGATDFIPLWTNSTGGLGNSVLFQSGTGSTAKVGINSTRLPQLWM